MKKLAPNTYRLRRVFDYLGVLLLVLLLMFIWQLYRGSITIPFLKPYIIKALNHDDAAYQVGLDSVNLELVRSIKPLRIIATNVTYRKNDGSISISAPKTSVSFSIKALLHGIVAPSSIDVYNPKVYLFTSYGLDKSKKEDVTPKKLEYYLDGFNEFIERFNSEDQTYAESFINEINIEDAEVELHEIDLGKKWVLYDVDYRFNRKFGGLETQINALLKLGKEVSSLGLEVAYKYISGKVAVAFTFSDLVPANLLALITSGEWQENYRVDVPLSGSIKALVNLQEVMKNRKDMASSIEKSVEKLTFSIEGGQGQVAFSDKQEDNFKIGAIALDGEVKGGLNELSIKEAKLELDGQTAELGLDAKGIKKYLLQSSPDDLHFTIYAGVKELETNKLYRYWPKQIATKAWTWCAHSLSEGTIGDATFSFDFGYDKKAKSITFEKLSGVAMADGVTLDYLDGMPKVTNVYGKVEFSNDKLQMYFDKGVSDNVILESGYIELYDLNKDNNYAKISLDGVGTISDILRLIDNKPLGYTSEMGINPDIIKGSAKAKLDLDFELKQSLAPHEVQVNVDAELHDVLIADAAPDKNVEAKMLNLHVDNQGLSVDGVANFDGIPLTLNWKENFASKDYQSRYQISFNYDNNFKQKMGIKISALGDKYIKGSIPAQATVTKYSNGKLVADINGDLKGAFIDYSFLGFKKKQGTEGVITVRLNMQDGKVTDIPLFSLSKPEFNLKGKATINSQGRLQTINISDIKGPKTAARAKIEIAYEPKEKVKINVSGSSYNLSDFFAKDEEEIKEAKEARKQKRLQRSVINNENDNSNQWEEVADTDINIAVNNLWTNDNVVIRNFAGNAKIINGIGINEMHLIGQFDERNKKRKPSKLKLDYTPRPNNEYVLNIESNDAGSTLKFLRLYDNMQGGHLVINAKRDADKNFVGHAKMRDFNVYNTPVFAKLLTVASFSGMVDLLTGEGMTFSHLDAPFEYKNSSLKIKDAKVFGNVVGVTANGSYSMDYQEFDIKGMVAPAYGLNTFIGSIPLVGNLLSGKDGTVFAANYSISGNIDEPDIDINPLSALSPNSLKELFSSMFGSEE